MRVLTDSAEMEFVRDVSEKLCYTALVSDTEFASIAKADKVLDLRAPRQYHHYRWRGYLHCLKYCSNQVSKAKKSADSMTLLSSRTRSAMLTSARRPSSLAIELAASTTVTPTTICKPLSSGILFRRIVERMTKELTTDSVYVDNSSRPRRGGSCREGQKRAKPTAGKQEQEKPKLSALKKMNIFGVGVPITLHVIARARSRVCITGSTSETPPMNAVTLETTVDLVSKSFQKVIKATLKPEYAVQPIIGLVYAHLDVDHDALWRAFLHEVRQRGAFEPKCSEVECDGYSERMLSSTRSTKHVCFRDEWKVVLSRCR